MAATISAGGYGGYGGGFGGGLGGGIGGFGGGYGGHGPAAHVGPNILYGGYTLTSGSISGPCKSNPITTA